MSQLPPTVRNWLADSLLVRRAWGEVNTPVGQLLFGRMGSQWGLGMLTNSGNCLDCDYGDTVDRFMFVSTKIAGHYVVPFIDFVNEGPTTLRASEMLGQPRDAEQTDDGHEYGLAIAKRDTDLEITRKLGAGQTIFNYGLYFLYRTQRFDAADWFAGGDPTSTAYGFVPRQASFYVPDLWAKFQTKKLRIEAEVAAVLGNISNSALDSAQASASNELTVRQLGAVVQSSYSVLDNLDLKLELGYASGDRAPGMGNKPGLTSYAVGNIDGAQYCVASGCSTTDSHIGNFRFNRDYRIDMILWREIFDGVTDALYVKPSVRFELTEGLGLWAAAIYSRAADPRSTPSNHINGVGALAGDASLGLEFNGGVTYDSGDGFSSGVSYGILLPFDGLKNFGLESSLGTAQALRGWFAIKY